MPIDQEAARETLLRSLAKEVRDERVLDAFRRIPREHFLPPELHQFAYEDRPLPIGHDQTISQPLIVGLMLQALDLRADDRALEVGTGSGYQTALLSLLVREVVTVERVPALAEQAAVRLRGLGYANVRVFVAGETLGWPEEAPYDAIVVSAGSPHVPRSLVNQLALNGRMIIPVGGRRLQQLLRVTKTEYGVTLQRLGECRFVPLIAAREGWPESEAAVNGARTA